MISMQGSRAAADGLPMLPLSSGIELSTRGLAHEGDLIVGFMRFRPSLCRAEINGKTQHLEPRVTRVLLALSQRIGTVLSRDDLIARCWDGVVVGDDAINRVISKIRHLTELSHAGFFVETVRRVGYRLVLSDPPPHLQDLAEPLEPSVFPTASQDILPLVAVLPFDGEGSPDAVSLANGTTDCILSTLTSDTSVAVVGKPRTNHFRGTRKSDAIKALGASQLVDGTVSVHGDEVRIIVFLIEGASGLTLWSDQVKGKLSDPFHLQRAVSQKVRRALGQAGTSQAS